MGQANPTGNPIRDPKPHPMRLLIARTDGRTNGRVTHLLKKSFSYVTRGRNQGNSISLGGGDCE
jgi:hypothetical protein